MPGMLDAIVGASLFASGLIAGWYLAWRSAASASDVSTSALERVITAHEDVVSRLFLACGLRPAPTPTRPESRPVAPTGVEAEETESVDNLADDDDDRDDFTGDHAAWVRKLDEERAARSRQ